MKTIGILTSGGDSPGMNACIAAIAARVESRGWAVRGIFGGFRGLAESNSIPIASEVAGLARRGGTFLGTSRGGNLEQEIDESGIDAALKSCCVDGVVVLGGGGSLKAAARLAAQGAKVVGVPCTIDNDVPLTDYTLGFDSALNKGIRTADEIMDTAESLPERIFLIETLGGTTGHIAIAVAHAVCADAVFVHEAPPEIEPAALRIKAKMDSGATHGLVVLCENLGTAEIARQIETLTGRRARVSALGHAQRGGSPTYRDREMARLFGEAAAEAILSDGMGTMVALQGGDVRLVPLGELAGKAKDLEWGKYRAVNAQAI